jgi:hypothetical protein
MVASATQQVVIGLRLEREDFLRGLREGAVEVRKLQGEHTKIARDGVKERDRLYADQNRRTLDYLHDQERAAVNTEKARQRAMQETNRRTIDILRDQEREARKGEVQQRRMAFGIMQATDSVLGLARGFALLGLTGEKSTEQLVKGLIKVEALFGILRGAIGAGTNLGRAFGLGATGGAWTAAGLGTAAGVGMGALTAREAWQHGPGGGATPGSYVERVGSAYWNPFYYLAAGVSFGPNETTPLSGRWQAENTTARMEKRMAFRSP